VPPRTRVEVDRVDLTHVLGLVPGGAGRDEAHDLATFFGDEDPPSVRIGVPDRAVPDLRPIGAASFLRREEILRQLPLVCDLPRADVDVDDPGNVLQARIADLRSYVARPTREGSEASSRGAL